MCQKTAVYVHESEKLYGYKMPHVKPGGRLSIIWEKVVDKDLRSLYLNTRTMQCTDSGGSKLLISVNYVVKPAHLRLYWTKGYRTSWLSLFMC